MKTVVIGVVIWLVGSLILIGIFQLDFLSVLTGYILGLISGMVMWAIIEEG